MKFIVEHLEQELNYLTEEKNGKKQTFIEGVFMQADKLNKNKRIYPK